MDARSSAGSDRQWTFGYRPIKIECGFRFSSWGDFLHLKMGGQKDLDLGLAVTLYKGTYHLRSTKIVTTDPGRAQPTQFNEGIRPKEGASQPIEASSRLFLKFVTSRDGRTPDETASRIAPVNDNETFNAVMTVNCGNHPLLVCFEIQAEKRITDPPPDLPNPQNCMNIRSRNQRQQHIYP
ncbi:uncharacterized protein LOC100893718 [Strongylocentrotus purpuratus]|uniref:Uncharacterized protein n=1 Tax=Strongylocentrotus purpuratus TaxID=7668 RepID=A0A7M7SZ49_STRPU|nr:uncharacterized protein LOC100893718 [Strongylocentrotus purpuratus]